MKNILNGLDDDSEIGFQQLRAQLKKCSLESITVGKSKPSQEYIKNNKDPQRSVQQRSLQSCSLSYQSGTNSNMSKSESGETSSRLINRLASINYSQKSVNRRKVYMKTEKKKWSQIKEVIKNQKINQLKEVFCHKVKRNNQHSKPIEYQYEENVFQKHFFNQKGIQLKQVYDKITSILFIYNIVTSIFFFTLWMVFPSIKKELSIKIIEIVGLIIFLVEIILNFVTVKFSLGRKLETIKEISLDYFQHRFQIDIISFLIIAIYLMSNSSVVGYFRLIMILKIPDCLDRIEKLEVHFIETYYKEQYWSLFKVFLFNFCFAHMLAILLLAMSNVNPNTNWLLIKGISTAQWYEQYIWAYYWATTMMLTIGFGDIVPSCYQEALCMIFIQTISCMVLAYNISCVGALISNIRSQDIEKSKNMKIFKKLVNKNNINQELSWKINNYIQQHTNIKKLFNIEQQAQFVAKLPITFRTDYLKQANKTIFEKVFFFNHLLQKTLLSLAQKIQMKIAHPQEIILSVEKNYDIFILKTGQIGYFSRKTNRKYSKHIFDRMKISQNDAPFLLNANFITKMRSNYGIKSIVYSVLYCLQYESLIQILGQSNLDFQLYCQERDKHKRKMDEFEVFPCEYCPNQQHLKFSCPKLHFMPISQQLVHRYTHSQKKEKSIRNTMFERMQVGKQSSLRQYLTNKQIYFQKKEEEQASYQANRLKEQKYVVDQLIGIGIESTQVAAEQTQGNKNKPSTLEDIAKMQAKFLQSTAEIIKMELNKTIGFENKEDSVWLLDLDRMKNYKDYFGKDNACNLGVAFDVEERKKRTMAKSVFTALTNIFEQKVEIIGSKLILKQDS